MTTARSTRPASSKIAVILKRLVALLEEDETRAARYFAGIDRAEFVMAIEQLNRRGIAFAISYDGKLGNKIFGIPLPPELGLKRIEIEVG
jgi:hypothetical protein